MEKGAAGSTGRAPTLPGFIQLGRDGALALPVGQRVLVADASRDSVKAAIDRAIATGGFTLEERTAPAGGTAPVIAERRIRRVPTYRRMRAVIIVLLIAGAVLGGVDAIITGTVFLAFPWFGVGGLGAGLLWWRYGRTYESEVIRATYREILNRRDGSLDGWELAWSAGRVLSVRFEGERTVVKVVDCPIPLMEALAATIRGCSDSLGVPMAPPPRRV